MQPPRFTSTLAVGFGLLLSSACGGGPRVTGSGPLVDDQRNLLPFDKVVLEAGVNLTITQGTSQEVHVNAQREVQPLLSTELKGDKLTIKMVGNANMDGGTNVEIVVADLEELSITSSGNSVVRGFSGDKLEVSLEGSGNTSLEQVQYDNLSVALTGSGDVDLAGRGDDLDVDLKSSGDVDAFALASNDVSVNSKGSGSVRVMASNSLKVDLKGSGNVYYKGSPSLEIKDDGSGKVEQQN